MRAYVHPERRVDLSSTDGNAVGLPTSHNFTATDAGSSAFAGVLLKTAGTQRITAADSLETNIIGTSVVTVTAAGATGLVFTTPPPNYIRTLDWHRAQRPG
jgi:hypothetical protein